MVYGKPYGEENIVNAWQRLRSTRLMSKPLLVLLVLALSLPLGCATPQQNPYMYTGAGLGAALGAGLGAAINNRNPWKGAAIGALLGGAAGGVAGDAYGRSNPYNPNYSGQGYGSGPYYGYQQSPPNYSYNQGDPYYNNYSQPPPRLQY
jgi:hypothetical protein